MILAVALAGCGGAPAEEGDEGAVKDDFDNTKAITVISREDGSGTRGAFIELVGIEEKTDDGKKVDHTTVNADIVNNTDIMLTSVAGDPYSIGYVSLGSLNDTVKAVPVEGVEASAEAIKDGSYTISRPFNIATKGEPNELAKDFIAFILSQEGQAIVNDNKYIAIDDQAAPYDGSKPSGTLKIAGSSSVAPVMEKLKEAYKTVNPNMTIEIQTSDSTAGMTATMEGICDIGMASRGLKDAEKAALTPQVIAMDGIAVIVNNKNPLADITKDQIKSIYIGDIVSWDAL
jgi:phosphate transport system substrate-binding protein